MTNGLDVGSEERETLGFLDGAVGWMVKWNTG